MALTLLLFTPTRALALEAEALVPVGTAVGIDLETEGVVVAGLGDVDTAQGVARPAEDAGLRVGDVIMRIGERRTDSAAEFLTALSEASGGALRLVVRRGGEEIELAVTPAQNREGAYQMGLWLRDGVSGIGTVTFYDPDSGIFGALGHGINDV